MFVYEKFLKRIVDFTLAFLALIIFSPLLLILSIIGTVIMRGNPFFIQKRPGKIALKTGKEKIFSLIKFRTMNNKKDASGNLLPDEQRLNAYGKWLRSTSLDELPSLVCIVVGNLSIVGPRPQLVRDMVFMSDEVRRRHIVRPGLTGLAQINGRNNITWEEKFSFDLQYIDKGITFYGDLKIILKTINKVMKKSDVVREGTSSDIDYGDWLLSKGMINIEKYIKKQEEAKELLEG